MMLVPRTAVVAVVAGLAIGPLALAAVGAPAPPGSPGVSARDVPVDARVGNLTQRLGSGTGALRLASASVRQDLVAGRVSGTFVLDAAPDAATASWLRLTFGHVSGTDCAGDLEFRTPTVGTLGPGFTRDGTTFGLDIQDAQAGYETWDCAFVVLANDANDPPTTPYSLLGGPLTNIYAQPRPVLSKPELLGSSKITLVRGVWTKVDVTVTNVGRVPAEEVLVSGAGKGVKVRTTSFGWINSGGRVTEKVSVRLTGTKRKAKLTLVASASAGAARDSREVVVRATRAPAPPVGGTYRSEDGTITFRVRKGKVTGFRGRDLRVACQPPGDVAVHYTATLRFPATTIARSGIVDDAEEYAEGDAWYNSWLEMKISGRRATNGHFAYVSAGSCRASEDFAARRVGR